MNRGTISTRTYLLAAAVSLAVTIAITALVLVDVLPPEWFFGGPVAGAALTGVVLGVRGWAPEALRATEAAEVARTFARAEQLLGAESAIRKELVPEEAVVVESLAKGFGRAEVPGRETEIRRS